VNLPEKSVKEFEFIESLKTFTKKDSLRGIGDDAVLVGKTLLALDQVVEGVHFTAGAPLENIIFRLFTANVSDIAAMGGRAENALLGIAIPPHIDKKKLSAAIQYACEHYGIDLVGGDTTSSKKHLFASLCVTGKPSAYILERNGARVGDDVFISRPVGGAAEMLARELAGEKIYDHYMFRAETELGRFLGEFGVNSCIDISDGLGRDASHIAEASGVRMDLDPRLIPEYGVFDAVSSGEEFALLFTVSKSASRELERLIHRDLNRPIYRIGDVNKGSGVYINGSSISERGYEHV
jgi:thiamine-monophosphate kinase